MLTFLKTLREEWKTVKSAPFSFLIACTVVVGLFSGGVVWFYHGSLSDADRQARQWKDDADYWKRVAERQKSSAATASPAAAPGASSPAPLKQSAGPDRTVPTKHAKVEPPAPSDAKQQAPAQTVISAPPPVPIITETTSLLRLV